VAQVCGHDRVLAAYDRGMPTKQFVRVFEVIPPAWARRLKQRRGDFIALRVRSIRLLAAGHSE
jgi:hypothetical protein